jgi:hypothetical protein
MMALIRFGSDFILFDISIENKKTASPEKRYGINYLSSAGITQFRFKGSPPE